MVLNVFFMIAGLAFLVIASNMLIEAVVRLADKLKVSKLVVSLTVVALGTSVPEAVVSIMAAANSSSIAFSNIVGSNIANVCLIFGVALLFSNMVIRKKMKIEIEKMTIITVIFIILSLIGMSLGRIDGVIFLLLLSIYIAGLFLLSKNDKELEDLDEGEEWIYRIGIKIFRSEWTVITLFLILGCLGLLLGGDLVVDSAVAMAKIMGINEGIIGATIVAIGTALPELVTTITAARKKHYDIIIGNIVGSNIINILFVLGVSAVVNKLPITKFEIEQIAILTLTTALFDYFTIRRNKLKKVDGIFFIAIYIVCIVIIALN